MSGKGNIKLVCLDTNIFIYFFEQNPRFYQTARGYFEKLEKGLIKASTTILTLTEILSFRNPAIAEDKLVAEFFDTPNLTVFDINRIIAVEAARIRRTYQFRLADSIQLATAQYSKADIFITNDEKIKKFKELKVILLGELK